ncbi:uncharacterized protein [Dermacentor albipictus]|uniref:uncharacterized protein n=1 Tax=Dermacentor albipictus TaxID=60249 RepID=UPI0038FC536E
MDAVLTFNDRSIARADILRSFRVSPGRFTVQWLREVDRRRLYCAERATRTTVLVVGRSHALEQQTSKLPFARALYDTRGIERAQTRPARPGAFQHPLQGRGRRKTTTSAGTICSSCKAAGKQDRLQPEKQQLLRDRPPSQPQNHQPSHHQPSNHQPSDHQPSAHQPSAHQPSAHQPGIDMALPGAVLTRVEVLQTKLSGAVGIGASIATVVTSSVANQENAFYHWGLAFTYPPPGALLHVIEAGRHPVSGRLVATASWQTEDEVVGNDTIRIQVGNFLVTEAQVNQAIQQLGDLGPYTLLHNNCQTFAKKLLQKLGIPWPSNLPRAEDVLLQAAIAGAKHGSVYSAARLL